MLNGNDAFPLSSFRPLFETLYFFTSPSERNLKSHWLSSNVKSVCFFRYFEKLYATEKNNLYNTCHREHGKVVLVFDYLSTTP
jgi:hypothetical protein